MAAELDRAGRVLEGERLLVAAQADSRAQQPGVVLRGGGRSALDLGDDLVGQAQHVVPPAPPVALVHPLHLEPEDAIGIAEAAGGVAALLVELEGASQVAVLDQGVAEIGVAADALERVAGDGDGDALLEVGDAPGIADAGSGQPDAVERVRAKLVDAELVGHLERLLADLDRALVLAGDHVKA